jgi:PAS domain S-box-containing protein
MFPAFSSADNAPGHPAAVQYAVAAGSVAAAVAIRAALHPVLGFDAPLLVFLFPTVMLALLFGAGAALFAMTLSAFVGSYLFIEPGGTVWLERSADQVRLVVFVIENIAIVALVSARRVRRAPATTDGIHQGTRVLTAILDATPHATIVADGHGRITVWNAAATRMFGFRAEEVLGARALHVPPEGLAAYEVMRARALHGETFDNVPLVRRRKDGAPVQCLVVIAPLRTDDRIVGTVTTLTERPD